MFCIHATFFKSEVKQKQITIKSINIMKSKFLTPAILLFSIAMFSSCKKEELTNKLSHSQESSIESQSLSHFSIDENSILNLIEAEEKQSMIYFDYSESNPLFLSSIPSHSESQSIQTLNESYRKMSEKYESDLSDEQKRKVETILAQYNDCKLNSIKRYRLETEQLKKTYSELVSSLRNALKNKRITEREYVAKMKDLRDSYSRKSSVLKLKLRQNMQICHQHFYKQLLRITNNQLKGKVGPKIKDWQAGR